MKRHREPGKYSRPRYDQAAKISARFGGEALLAKALGVARTTIYRWQYQPPVGTDGLVPSSAVKRVLAAARREGIVIRWQDWEPQRVVYDDSDAWQQASPPNKTQQAHLTLKDIKHDQAVDALLS
jgi:hypothetical protein